MSVSASPGAFAGARPAPRPAWLGLHRPALGPVRARLLILPFAGGNASAFFPWMKEIGAEDWLELAVLQPPGRGTRFREAPVASLEEYAAAVRATAQALADQGGAAPLFVMGYSMGALVGYLAARGAGPGLPVARLIAAARKAPRPRAAAEYPPRRPMSREAVLARLRSLQGTPEAVLRYPELIEPYLGSIAAEFHLVDSYASPELPPLECPVTAISGLDDPETPRAGVFDWEHLTREGFAAHFLPGGHFFMNTARPAFQRLVRLAIDQHLDGVDR